MKLTRKTLIRWKIYFDRARMYVSYVQFLLIGMVFIKQFKGGISGFFLDHMIWTIPLMLIVFVVCCLIVGYLDHRLGIRAEEYNALSEANPMMIEIRDRLRKDSAGRYLYPSLMCPANPSRHCQDLKYSISECSGCMYNKPSFTREEMDFVHGNRDVHIITQPGLAMKRELCHLTLRQVSALTGISTSTISRIEQGKECKLSNINKLIQFYEGRYKSGAGSGEPDLFSTDSSGRAGSGSEPPCADSGKQGEDSKADPEIHEEEIQH